MKVEEYTKFRAKAVLSGGIGNVMEWYDFAVYGYLASTISGLFFPSENPLAALTNTFLLFAIGFIARPLGAFVIGHYGDKAGRKNALVLTVSLMALGTLLLGIMPTYSVIGVWAPIGVAIARLIQGFSAGGEWGGSTSFMVEYAAERRRGYIGSWQQVTVATGLLLGSITGMFTTLLPQDILESWGWRLPFIIGAVLIGLIGFYLRLRVPETPKFVEIESAGQKSTSPLAEVIKKNYKEILLALGFTVVWTVTYYMFLTYMPSYASVVLKIPSFQAFLSSSINLAVFIILIPVFGYLSDKYGRKPFLIASSAGFLVLTYPLLYIAGFGIQYLFLSQLIIAIMLAMFSGPGPAAIAEIFPTRVRYSGLSIGYNIAVAGFGGTAPYIASLLISTTGSRLSPAFYVIGSAAATLVTLLFIRETAKEALR
jgi:MHS family proline/betaine transporter-like MFS transporter